MRFLLFTFLMFTIHQLSAQMPNDAIYMPSKSVCAGVMLSHSQWSNYWEGSIKRNNLNLGTFQSQSAMAMAAIGITKDINLIATLPYIATKAPESNLLGSKGIQDLSLWLKARKTIYDNKFSLNGIVGFSTPLTNYVTEFQPFSIGTGAKTFTTRLLALYNINNQYYVSGHASYVSRGKVKLDRDSYMYNDKVINSNLVDIPNALDFSARVGRTAKGLQTDVIFDHFQCVSGDNIRTNDMPFLSNKVEFSQIGFYSKYQPKKFGANVRVNYILKGQNMGQAITAQLGLLYQFSLKN